MRSIEYWADRAIKREAVYQARSGKTIAQVRKAYEKAFENIAREIRAIEYNAAKAGEDEQEPYLARISRFEGLKEAIEAEVSKLARFETRVTREHYSSVIEEAFYRTMFDIQKGTGYAFGFSALPVAAIKETLQANWSGKNFSARVWANTYVLAEEANEIINAGLLAGTSSRKMVEQLLRVVDPTYAGVAEENRLEHAKFVATRLIRTEVNYFSNQGELRSYKEADIERYRYVATLDNRTSQVCQDLDLETFPVADAVVGKNYPPMHPFCRSTTIAVIEGREENGLKRRARDSVTGETYLVDSGMNYNTWYNEKARPQILTDDERYAINKYISSESYLINEKLRDGAELSKFESKIVRDLDSALMKLPGYKGLASRSITLNGNALEKFLEDHSVDEIVLYKAYSSFTIGETYDTDANIQLWVDIAKAKNLMEFNSDEREILYQRGAKFKVDSVEISETGVINILLEEELK